LNSEILLPFLVLLFGSEIVVVAHSGERGLSEKKRKKHSSASFVGLAAAALLTVKGDAI